MFRLTTHDDVLRLQTASSASRLVGYTASAFLYRDVLVDTGIPAVSTAMARWLDARVAAGRMVRGALLTHAHEDHAGNAALLAHRGVPLAMGAATAHALRAPERPGLYRRLTWGRLAPLGDAWEPMDPAPLALVPTPGHSPDHHVVWDPMRATVFGGDLFIGVKVRIAHDEEDPPALVRSLRAVAALAPRRLFDAHRGLVRDPAPHLLAKAEWLEETIDAIARLVAAGWSDAPIRDRVLGREPLTGVASRGEYSCLGLVRAVRRTLGAAAQSTPNNRAASAS